MKKFLHNLSSKPVHIDPYDFYSIWNHLCRCMYCYSHIFHWCSYMVVHCNFHFLHHTFHCFGYRMNFRLFRNLQSTHNYQNYRNNHWYNCSQCSWFLLALLRSRVDFRLSNDIFHRFQRNTNHNDIHVGGFDRESYNCRDIRTHLGRYICHFHMRVHKLVRIRW